MKYIEVLKKLNIINVEQLIKEIEEIFNIFSLPLEEHQNVLNNAAKLVVRKQTITHFIAKNTFKLVYIDVLKKKILDGSLDMNQILKQNPQIKDNLDYKELIKTYKKGFENYNKLSFDLPFTVIDKSVSRTDILNMLKNCTEIQYNYVFSHLTEKEKDIFVKKYGDNLDKENELNISESDFLKDVILPKINNLINRFAGYYYFDQIFADKKNKYEQQAAFYNLENRYKRILISCYGPELDKSLDSNISSSLEHKLRDLVIPRLRMYKCKAANHRKAAMFQQIFMINDQYTLSMLPQSYIDLINIAVNNERKVFSTCSNSVETKELIRGIDAILEIILTSEEVSIVSHHLGLHGETKLIFKDIAKKFNLTESRVLSIYANVVEKLTLSPEIKKLYKHLNKMVDNSFEITIQNINKKKDIIQNATTNFYGFFTSDEVKKLPDGMKCMNADELLFINSLFYQGLSKSINLKNISVNDKIYLEQIIIKIKKRLTENSNLNFSISSQKIYYICSRLYVDPIYNEICVKLSSEEREILDLCIKYEELGDSAIKYISTLINKTNKEVLAILKFALQKVYEVLEERSKSNVLIRHLLLTEN